MRAWIAAMVVASGCAMAGCAGAGDMTVKPHQVEIVDLIWHEIYGQNDDPPQVEWHHVNQLFGSTGGFTYAGWKILVADKCDSMPEYNCWIGVIPHELMHERTFRRTGDVDAFHYRGDWDLADRAEAIAKKTLDAMYEQDQSRTVLN